MGITDPPQPEPPPQHAAIADKILERIRGGDLFAVSPARSREILIEEIGRVVADSAAELLALIAPHARSGERAAETLRRLLPPPR